MADVSEKPVTIGYAVGKGRIDLQQSTVEAITGSAPAENDVLEAARSAGISAAKRCDELIPASHVLPLDRVSVNLEPESNPPGVEITSEVVCQSKTGAEMEALVAVSAAALSIYDTVKEIDESAEIGDIHLVEKIRGNNRHFIRKERL